MKNFTLTLALVISSLSTAFAKVESFEVDGNKAYVEDAPKPAKGKPWMWYAPNNPGRLA